MCAMKCIPPCRSIFFPSLVRSKQIFRTGQYLGQMFSLLLTEVMANRNAKPLCINTHFISDDCDSVGYSVLIVGIVAIALGISVGVCFGVNVLCQLKMKRQRARPR